LPESREFETIPLRHTTPRHGCYVRIALATKPNLDPGNIR
jgi:hypothetical protein